MAKINKQLSADSSLTQVDIYMNYKSEPFISIQWQHQKHILSGRTQATKRTQEVPIAQPALINFVIMTLVDLKLGIQPITEVPSFLHTCQIVHFDLKFLSNLAKDNVLASFLSRKLRLTLPEQFTRNS